MSQEELQAIYALVHDPKGRPKWAGAQWIGACSRGHLVVSAISLVGYQCDDCTPGGQDEHHPRYINLPRQDVLLAAFHFGGWDAVVIAAKAML